MADRAANAVASLLARPRRFLRAATIVSVTGVACASPATRPGPTEPAAPVAPTTATSSSSPAAGASEAAEAAESSEAADQAERLAAIQHAMNQLDEGAQLCWAAAAAVEGYELAGELALLVDIARPVSTVTVARDNTKSSRLVACMQQLLAGYAWAAPLTGQTIQLPFAFRAPRSQSVIDRRWIPAQRQGQVAITTLLDERNTGSAAASMFEIEIAAGGSTGLRVATRSEAWMMLGAGTVAGAKSAAVPFSAGDLLLVPAGGQRKLTASAGAALRAVLVVTPGGEEGSARAGALPTPEVSSDPPRGSSKPAPAFVLARAAQAVTYVRPGGGVKLFLDPVQTKRGELSASVLTFDAGTAVPLHQHPTETELLYILEGSGTLTLGELTLPVGPTSVLQLPPGVPHAFVAAAPLRALQLYTPAGPEQRFKAPAPPARVP